VTPLPPIDSLVVVGESFSLEHRFDPRQVIEFARAAGDDNPLHHDAEVARRSRFGGLIVSGTQTATLMFGLTATYFSKRTTVLGLSFSIDYEQAVPADARVAIHWSVIAVESAIGRRGGQVVHLKGRMLREDGSRCASATGKLLVGADVASLDARGVRAP
jgi:3-hydroxybutyryl-CoA dehydratase